MLIRSDMTQAPGSHPRPRSCRPSLAEESQQQAGWFRFSFEHDRWEWSALVARIHGYSPGQVEPDARLVLSASASRRPPTGRSDHRRDSPHVAGASNKHRIIDASGQTRQVVLIGEPVTDEQGAVTGIHGFYVEVMPARDQVREQRVSDAIAEIADARAGIEQAKGMLMMVYRIDAEAAFELLKWRSQATNTKLRALSEQVAVDFMGVNSDATARSEYDSLLLTAHLRVPAHG